MRSSVRSRLAPPDAAIADEGSSLNDSFAEVFSIGKIWRVILHCEEETHPVWPVPRAYSQKVVRLFGSEYALKRNLAGAIVTVNAA